jgi:hypothetical protein
VNAEQKAHVLAQLKMAEHAVALARSSVTLANGQTLIGDEITLRVACGQIAQARERLEIAQYAIDGLLGVKP